MKKPIVAISLLMSVVLASCHQSQQPVSWLNPSDQELLKAASAGFQGKEPEPLRLKSYDASQRCLGGVRSVDLYTPLWRAQADGYYAMKHFDKAPTLADVAGERYSASIAIDYEADSPNDEAIVVVSSGEGAIYKPATTSALNPDTTSCGETSPYAAWSLGVDASFKGPNALPATGKGTLIVRRRARQDESIDVDFDSIPASSSPAQPE
jgi:hypothetical protein